jgi:hypothetical protein
MALIGAKEVKFIPREIRPGGESAESSRVAAISTGVEQRARPRFLPSPSRHGAEGKREGHCPSAAGVLDPLRSFTFGPSVAPTITLKLLKTC